MLKSSDRFFLDLAYAFTGDIEALAHVLERFLFNALKAEAVLQNFLFAMIELRWTTKQQPRQYLRVEHAF